MNPPATSPRHGRLRGLALSQLLAMSLLALCVWWVYRELEIIVSVSKIIGAISWQSEGSAVLNARLAAFGLAVVLVHAGLGFLAWLLARMTLVAFPALNESRLNALIAGWFLLLAALVLATNATWYPASRYTAEDSWLRGEWLGLMPIDYLAAATGIGILACAWLAVRRTHFRPRRWQGAVAALALLGLSFWFWPILGTALSRSDTGDSRPHVVILGVDSLRDDLSEASEGRTLTPNIDAFLADAHRFRDTASPLARTFPAWVSILTGRHPVTTNARFNLMPRALVEEGDTLADALKAKGYQAVFATDEVRFANFDGSYGFDQLITPPIGASDFLIGTVGGLPLVNLIAGTPAGGWLFPAIYANRAAAVTYEPRDFVARLDRELRIEGPSLLAIHLTLAHWPYSWAGQERPSNPPEFRPAYRRALAEVDRQFADVVELLRKKGVLDNALVVVLSDHGEALGFKSDSMLRRTGTENEIWDSLWGHGTSVMSPHQYNVVLAMRGMGRAAIPGTPSEHDWPVDLADVRPTLEELVTGKAPGRVDGISLVPYLAAGGDAPDLDGRIRFTETCFNTIKMMKGKITASGLAGEGAIYYELDRESGWVQLKPERLAEVMSKKQRAALSRNSILAAIPSWTDGSVTFLYSDRHSPHPRRLVARPDPRSDPEAAHLWEALEQRFPGEIPATVGLP